MGKITIKAIDNRSSLTGHTPVPDPGLQGHSPVPDSWSATVVPSENSASPCQGSPAVAKAEPATLAKAERVDDSVYRPPTMRSSMVATFHPFTTVVGSDSHFTTKPTANDSVARPDLGSPYNQTGQVRKLSISTRGDE